ncbi:sodium-dependent transporter [Sesbania bispinosa]|nr:sodium-dependent transporter [Sesbania bispinosa]
MFLNGSPSSLSHCDLTDDLYVRCNGELIFGTTQQLQGGEEAVAGCMITYGLRILWVRVMEEEMVQPCDGLAAVCGDWFKRLRWLLWLWLVVTWVPGVQLFRG